MKISPSNAVRSASAAVDLERFAQYTSTEAAPARPQQNSVAAGSLQTGSSPSSQRRLAASMRSPSVASGPYPLASGKGQATEGGVRQARTANAGMLLASTAALPASGVSVSQQILGAAQTSVRMVEGQLAVWRGGQLLSGAAAQNALRALTGSSALTSSLVPLLRVAGGGALALGAELLFPQATARPAELLPTALQNNQLQLMNELVRGYPSDLVMRSTEVPNGPDMMGGRQIENIHTGLTVATYNGRDGIQLPLGSDSLVVSVPYSTAAMPPGYTNGAPGSYAPSAATTGALAGAEPNSRQMPAATAGEVSAGASAAPQVQGQAYFAGQSVEADQAAVRASEDAMAQGLAGPVSLAQTTDALNRLSAAGYIPAQNQAQWQGVLDMAAQGQYAQAFVDNVQAYISHPNNAEQMLVGNFSLQEFDNVGATLNGMHAAFPSAQRWTGYLSSFNTLRQIVDNRMVVSDQLNAGAKPSHSELNNALAFLNAHDPVHKNATGSSALSPYLQQIYDRSMGVNTAPTAQTAPTDLAAGGVPSQPPLLPGAGETGPSWRRGLPDSVQDLQAREREQAAARGGLQPVPGDWYEDLARRVDPPDPVGTPAGPLALPAAPASTPAGATDDGQTPAAVGAEAGTEVSTAPTPPSPGAPQPSGPQGPRSYAGDDQLGVSVVTQVATTALNLIGQAGQTYYYQTRIEARKPSSPLDPAAAQSELRSFIADPPTYMTTHYDGGPNGVAIDGAIYKETSVRNDIRYFQRMPMDLYQALSDSLGHPEVIRVPQLLDINGQGEHWVTVEMLRPVHSEFAGLGGKVDLMPRQTNNVLPSGRVSATLGAPESAFRSRVTGEFNLFDPYLRASTTVLEYVPLTNEMTLRQESSLQLSVLSWGQRASIGNESVERVDDNSAARQPQVTVTAGNAFSANIPLRLDFRYGETNRVRAKMPQVSVSSSGNITVSDPDARLGNLLNDVSRPLYEQFAIMLEQNFPGVFEVIEEPGTDKYSIGLAAATFGSGPDAQTGSRNRLSVPFAPEVALTATVQSEGVPVVPDTLMQEFLPEVAAKLFNSASTGTTVNPAEEMTSFGVEGTHEQATPFQSNVGDTLNAWATALNVSPASLQGRFLPTDGAGQVVAPDSPEGQAWRQALAEQLRLRGN
jgi:hypothetical protein